MKKIFTFGTLLLLTCISIQAQYISRIDHLTSTLKSKHGAELIDVYNSIAWEYRKSYPDSTLSYTQRAIGLMHAYGIKTQMARSFNFMGVAYHYKGDHVKSFDHHNKAIREALTLKDSSQYAHALNNLGRLFLSQGDFVKAYDYCFNALKIFQRLNDEPGLGYNYKNLAEIYQSQNAFGKALKMTEKALNIRLKTHNIPGQISLLIELAQIRLTMGHFNKAFDYYLQARIKSESINDVMNIANINTGISKLYFQQKKYPEALEYAEKALGKVRHTQNIDLLTRIYLQLGLIFKVQKQLNRAEYYFQEVLSHSSKSGALALQEQAYLHLSEICYLRNELQCSYDYYKKHSEIQIALNDAEAARAIERLEARIEIEKKEKENKILLANQARDRALIDQQRGYNITLGIVIFVIILFMIHLWSSGRKRRAINEKLIRKNDHINKQRQEIKEQNAKINAQNVILQGQNKHLEKANIEKDNMMNIVAHDLKSPFNRVRGIAEILKSSNLSKDQKKYVSLLQSVSEKGIALITDLLDVNSFEHEQRKPELAGFDIYSLLQDKLENFAPEARAKNIQLRIESTDPPVLVKSDEKYISRILDNLISNAIKFSGKHNTVILKAGYILNSAFISIKDFGQGFTEEDKKDMYKKFTTLSAQPTGGENSNGLGLAIVKTLVESLGGEVKLNSAPDRGSEFVITFPANVGYMEQKSFS